MYCSVHADASSSAGGGSGVSGPAVLIGANAVCMTGGRSSSSCARKVTYGVAGDVMASHCQQHGRPLGLVRLIHPRMCRVLGCRVPATFGLSASGDQKWLACAFHGRAMGMHNTTNARCRYSGCVKKQSPTHRPFCRPHATPPPRIATVIEDAK